MQALPDVDALAQADALTDTARLAYWLYVTQPGSYTVWLRGYASNAAGDSAYLSLGQETVSATGFAPGAWQSRITELSR